MKARSAKIAQNWIYTFISLISVSTIVAAYFVTRDNFNLMREDMEMRNRPILSLEDWNLDLNKERYGRDICKFSWETKNYGQTPATNVSLELKFYSVNDNELYSRTIYRNKYLVPGKAITQETENISSEFALPSDLKLYQRFQNERLHMKIKLKYNGLKERKRQYLYEISGYIREDGWKTSSESWDELARQENTIYLKFPEGHWMKYGFRLALNTSLLEGHKLHTYLVKKVADFFSGKKMYVFAAEFALAVKDVDEELKKSQRLSFVSPKESRKKRR
ncbi:MAG: hypothetical protein NT145_00200 [Elusimicrobia bacterium]|nr:hypothetical protein [Elusimicrobiota bacterium]